MVKEKDIQTLLGHEVNTPLAIAYNHAYLLRMLLEKHGSVLDSHYDYVLDAQTSIMSALERLQEISQNINDLFDVEDPEFVRLQTLDHFEDHLQSLIMHFEKKAHLKALSFSCRYNQTDSPLVGPGTQFKHILFLLLDNAIKYTSKGFVNMFVDISEQKMCARVVNSGFYIPKPQRLKVFEKFYRHKNKANKFLHNIPGLGLGLYVVRRIAERMGGRVCIEKSGKAEGTTFVVELPVASGTHSGR